MLKKDEDFFLWFLTTNKGITQIQIHKYNIKKGYFFQFFEPNQKSILLLFWFFTILSCSYSSLLNRFLMDKIVIFVFFSTCSEDFLFVDVFTFYVYFFAWFFGLVEKVQVLSRCNFKK